MSFRAALKSYADSSPSFLVATCCQTHSQVYAESFQKIAPCNRLPTFLFWIVDAVIFLGRVFLLVFFGFVFCFPVCQSGLLLWLLWLLVCWLLMLAFGFWLLLAFVGFCWLFAFVGFLLLLAFVGFWMWFHFAFGFWPGFLRVGFSWLLLFWLRWAFLRDTPFCWNYIYVRL